MSDAPERRRANANAPSADKPKVNPFVKYRVPLVILLLWGGIVSYNVLAADEAQECPGHWHSTMSVFVDGERVIYTANGDYTLEGGTMPLSTHMHQGSESLWHFEPSKVECIPLEDATKRVQTSFGDDYLELSGDYHEAQGWGGRHVANETHSVQAWMKPWQGDWESVDVSDLAKMQVPDGAQVVVSYGTNDAGAVAQMQETAQPIPGNQTPSGNNATSGGTNWVAVGAVTMFALVGLMIWRTFTKGVA